LKKQRLKIYLFFFSEKKQKSTTLISNSNKIRNVFIKEEGTETQKENSENNKAVVIAFFLGVYNKRINNTILNGSV